VFNGNLGFYMRVKILSSSVLGCLEDDINNWLLRNEVRIFDIKYSELVSDGNYYCTCFIAYESLDTEIDQQH